MGSSKVWKYGIGETRAFVFCGDRQVVVSHQLDCSSVNNTMLHAFAWWAENHWMYPEMVIATLVDGENEPIVLFDQSGVERWKEIKWPTK